MTRHMTDEEYLAHYRSKRRRKILVCRACGSRRFTKTRRSPQFLELMGEVISQLYIAVRCLKCGRVVYIEPNMWSGTKLVKPVHSRSKTQIL